MINNGLNDAATEKRWGSQSAITLHDITFDECFISISCRDQQVDREHREIIDMVTVGVTFFEVQTKNLLQPSVQGFHCIKENDLGADR